MEMGRSDGHQIDQYLATGDSNWLNQVTIYGYQGAAQALKSISDSAKTDTEQMHYFGFDVDVLPGGGYKDIAQLLSKNASNILVQRLNSMLLQVPGESLHEESSRLNRAADFVATQMSAFISLLGEESANELTQSILCL